MFENVIKKSEIVLQKLLVNGHFWKLIKNESNIEMKVSKYFIGQK